MAWRARQTLGVLFLCLTSAKKQIKPRASFISCSTLKLGIHHQLWHTSLCLWAHMISANKNIWRLNATVSKTCLWLMQKTGQYPIWRIKPPGVNLQRFTIPSSWTCLLSTYSYVIHWLWIIHHPFPLEKKQLYENAQICFPLLTTVLTPTNKCACVRLKILSCFHTPE